MKAKASSATGVGKRKPGGTKLDQAHLHFLINMHDRTFQQTTIFILTTVLTSNLKSYASSITIIINNI
jgi:hypothetical protein